MRAIFCVVMVFVAGCAAQQRVDLLPRGGTGVKGTGQFDHIYQRLTVELGGEVYQGTPISETAQTSFSLFSPGATTSTNKQAALLIGPAGQVRCDFAWDQLKTRAIGVCVDSRNITYDLLIEN